MLPMPTVRRPSLHARRARAAGRLPRSIAVAGALTLALPAGAAAKPFGFLAQPTDQLGIPGVEAGVEVTPEGALFTGWGEETFRAGPGLAAWKEPTRTLAGGRWPVLTSTRRAAGVDYALTVFADLVDGHPVAFARVVMRGVGPGTHVGRFGAGIRETGGSLKADGVTRSFRFPRPAAPSFPGLYTQPGTRFSPHWTYAFERDTLTRDGAMVLTVPHGARRRLRPDGPGPVTPGTVFGLSDVRVRLAPGRTATADFRMPVEPLAAGDPAIAAVQAASFIRRRDGVLRTWRGRLAGAMTIAVPEAKVRDAYTASLVNILVARTRDSEGRWIQGVNKLRYQAFWLRDAAMLTNTLDRVGLFSQAAENLPFFAAWQHPDGLLISRSGQYDGIGQALWAVGEHAVRAQDDALGRAWLGRVDAAVGWISRERAKDPLGLLPAGDPHDDELVAGHLAGDDFWAVAGLEAVVAMARRLHDDVRAQRWQGELDGLRAAVRRAAGTQAIKPAFDVPGGTDWGNLWAAWPGTPLAADAPAVTRTMAAARRQFREGIATWGVPRRSLHGYLGFRVFETELLRDEQARVVDGLYASLAHTTASHGGFETGIRPFAARSVDDNLAPHGWFAAEYVQLLRNMLVRDLPGGGVELGSALAPAWLAPGRHVRVGRAPVLAGGTVAWSLHATRGGGVLHWRSTAPAGTPLRWRVPAGLEAVRAPGLAAGSGVLALHGATGRARITWRRPAGPQASFARTARALAAAYRATGLAAPTGSPGPG